jgi:hypothetical protein
MPNLPISTPLATLGSDVLCHRGAGVWDLDPTFAVVEGPAVVVEHMGRALMTRPGTMGDEPARGRDVSMLENARTAAGAGREIQSSIDAELRQDDRIDSLDVKVTIAGDDWTIEAAGVLSDGAPFDSVFALGAGTVSILTGEAA